MDLRALTALALTFNALLFSGCNALGSKNDQASTSPGGEAPAAAGPDVSPDPVVGPEPAPTPAAEPTPSATPTPTPTPAEELSGLWQTSRAGDKVTVLTFFDKGKHDSSSEVDPADLGFVPMERDEAPFLPRVLSIKQDGAATVNVTGLDAGEKPVLDPFDLSVDLSVTAQALVAGDVLYLEGAVDEDSAPDCRAELHLLPEAAVDVGAGTFQASVLIKYVLVDRKKDACKKYMQAVEKNYRDHGDAILDMLISMGVLDAKRIADLRGMAVRVPFSGLRR